METMKWASAVRISKTASRRASKAGPLTAGETARLERQQQSINREDASMRAANGGKLTSADRAALNQRQKNASRNIYAKKHNAAHTRP